MNYKSKDFEHVWHPYDTLKLPEQILIKSAEGIFLKTDDGREIIDAISSWWVNLHGHGNPTIADAIAAQARSLEHVIFAGFTHEPAINLADQILEELKCGHTKAFFSDNGSTAVEVALKMALQFWFNKGKNRTKIIAIEGAYHGDTFGAMSVGGRTKFNQPFEQFLFDVAYIPLPDQENFDEVVSNFTNLVASNDIAAFIYEPLVQGASGMRMYAPQHLDILISLAHKNDVLCIADEVMTGFYRTGKFVASQYCDNKPDIICLSKGITGGFMPLGLTTCLPNIYDAFVSDDPYKVFFHGHSYTGNPLACAAALASLSLLRLPDCLVNIQMIANEHDKFAKVIQAKFPNHKIRHIGTILAIEIITNTPTSYFNELKEKLYFNFLKKNILLRPLGNVLYILPMYCITEQQLRIIYKVIIEELDGG